MPSLDLGVVGNCNHAALIDRQGCIVWWCLPAFDGDPVFCRLLNQSGEQGFFDIVPADGLAWSEQEYIPNTAILRTRLYDSMGNGLQITDVAPRFTMFGRRFRPPTITRILEPIAGKPSIVIRLRPSFDYGATAPNVSHGSNHIRFTFSDLNLRLTTDAPLPYILKEQKFLLNDRMTLYLGPDEPLDGPVDETGRHFFEETLTYWRTWVRALNIPLEWQEPVIRSAITLKLCSYEPTGGLVAALTTSIPEAANTVRNWDYRFCWLRDAYFVVQALNQIGAHQTMEDYLLYIDDLVGTNPEQDLQPVYGLALESELPERTVDSLPGYRGMGPVRSGNLAYEQDQHDGYGHVILASTQAFFDTRLLRQGGIDDFHRLEHLGERAFRLHAVPDAGMWELRNNQRVHTSSSLMCWAACDRLANIAAHLMLGERSRYWRKRADEIHDTICARAWNADLGCFTGSFEGNELDANLLLLEEIGFLAADDPRFASTVAAIEKHLRRGPHMFRYVVADDFGLPENAFIVCSFWYINALHALGRREEARELLEGMLASRNHLGLLSEDINTGTGELWGNFPQTYSHVGLINCAMRLSRPWRDAR
ncbi:MAG: glycoside hydrolase family 15 protein [Alphaproteobacteria bacterium]|jgi:GH15 family glucan-1,4-alpha-glucosidase|nr:glycoside hydrolase family 15 protein [Alphaproteobacteria bacterium]